jgi:hypothetical protein
MNMPNVSEWLRSRTAKQIYSALAIMLGLYLILMTGIYIGRNNKAEESRRPENYFYTVTGLLTEKRLLVCNALGIVKTTDVVVPAPVERVLLSYDILTTVPMLNESFCLKRGEAKEKYRVLMMSPPANTRAPVQNTTMAQPLPYTRRR